MTPPPKQVKDRSHVWQACAECYGRPWKQVRDLIQQKRAHYARLDAEWQAMMDLAREEAEKEAKARRRKA